MKLVISEKPSVAASIARVIGADERKDGYFEGNGYIVSWCVGHLIELAQPQEYDEAFEKWSYETLPIIPDNWKYKVKSETAKQYRILRDLMNKNDVETVVCATDAGREGELIFRLVYDMAGCTKPYERLWISSMEDSAILEGMSNLHPGSDYNNLYSAALARQNADWLVGINGTRLFTVLYGGKLLKVGRVQTPTLAMIVEREQEITGFKKQQYFMTHILVEVPVSDGLYDGIDAVSERIDSKQKADDVAALCKGNTALVVSVEKEKKRMAPPKLYDLTSLQRDANRMFGFTAKQTLEYTQNLYEKKLVTYPRTDSRFLTDDMELTAGNVISIIKNVFTFIPGTTEAPDIKRVMNSKKVSDHHAIIPTAEIAKTDLKSLDENESRILHLIAVRILYATGSVHMYESQKIIFECAGTQFTAKGRNVTEQGWKVYEDALKNVFRTGKDEVEETEDANGTQKLPDIHEGDTFENTGSEVTEHFTNPPARFTEATILTAMEKAGTEDMESDVERKGLGTPATRADIIEKLVKDGFVKREKKTLVPTDDGIKLITVLPDRVKSPKLTADWENALALIAKGELAYDGFMDGITDMVESLVRTYHSVSDEDKKMFSRGDVLGKCPSCGGDVVKGIYGYYCKNKCGMSLNRIMGVGISETQLKSLLAGKKILLKGIKKKSCNGTFDAYIIPEGIEDYSYKTTSGNEVSGKQFKFKMEFPKRKG